MRVRSLDREDPLEEGVATHSSVLAWRILWTEEPGGLTVHGVTESQTRLKRLRAGGGLKIFKHTQCCQYFARKS